MNKKFGTVLMALLLSLNIVGCDKNKNNNIDKADNHNNIVNNNNHNNDKNNDVNDKNEKDDKDDIDEAKTSELIDSVIALNTGEAGSSLKTAKLFTDILNNGSVLLTDKDDSREIVINKTDTLPDLNNYNATISQIEGYGNDYFNDANKQKDIEKLIQESGSKINDNHLTKDQFNEVMNILKIK